MVGKEVQHHAVKKKLTATGLMVPGITDHDMQSRENLREFVHDNVNKLFFTTMQSSYTARLFLSNFFELSHADVCKHAHKGQRLKI